MAIWSTYKVYDSFDDFKEDFPEEAEAISNEKHRIEDASAIYYFDNTDEFVDYELSEGWYFNLFGDVESNLRGAPNPLEYIDADRFFDALKNTWDDGAYWTDDTIVVHWAD